MPGDVRRDWPDAIVVASFNVAPGDLERIPLPTPGPDTHRYARILAHVSVCIHCGEGQIAFHPHDVIAVSDHPA